MRKILVTCSLIFVALGFILIPMSHAKNYRSVSASINGSCFEIALTSKKQCAGSIKVGFYKNGKGYWLEDQYSMIKNGKERISGCWDPGRAEIGKGPYLSGTLNMQQGTIQIFLDGKKVKESRF